MNKQMKILAFLVREGFISETYLSVLVDIALRQAKTNAEKETNTKINFDLFKKAIEKECFKK